MTERTRKSTAIILALAMLAAHVLALSGGVLASGGGFCALPGRGTERDPYLISSKEELCLLADAVNGGETCERLYFALSGDIDLFGMNWRPIGCDKEHPFMGSFDGAGFTVKNLTVFTDEEYAGLFGVSRGAVTDVRLTGVTVCGADHAGAAVGFGCAEGCSAEGTVMGSDHVGGVVGEGAAYGCVGRCTVKGVSRAGGVIGTGDAYGCVNYGSVQSETYAGGVAGLGAVTGCTDGGEARELYSGAPRDEVHSVANFISWALTHVDPSSIPTNAHTYIPFSSCGTEPWEYLYGSIRAPISTNTLNNFFNNYYGKYMLRAQYDEITAGWSRETYATDCQGLLDAYMTYMLGISTDINASMNYSYWCTDKGEIADIDRPWAVGEAVFVYSRRLGRMGHIGWICGFDEDGEPLVLEAKGQYYGVIVTRFASGSWTHRGLMTAKFYYDADLDPTVSGAYSAPLPDTAEILPDAGAPAGRSVWSGGIAEGFAGGDGTEGNPYLVTSGEELAYLAYAVRSGDSFSGEYVAMTQDVWLNDTDGWRDWSYFNQPANIWQPIGFYTNSSTNYAFRGSFDGRGHTVYGIFCDENNKSFEGLFGYVGPNPTGCIKNVSVARSNTNAVDNMGGIVGLAKDYGRIENCHFYGIVKGDIWIGGIVGCVMNSQGTTVVYGCSNGGLVAGLSNVGGIVGFAHENCIVSFCVNAGSAVKGFERVGGIIGKMNYSTVKKCRNNGAVSGTDMIGGTAGWAVSSEIFECYSAGSVSGFTRMGGIAGRCAYGSVFDCFNTGEIRGTELVGGVMGSCAETETSTVYNVGTVSARRHRGGAIGYFGAGATISDSLISAGCCAGGNDVCPAIPAYAFTDESSYGGFDFESVWILDPGTEYPFAELRNARYTAELIPVFDPPDPTPGPTVVPTPSGSPDPTPSPTPSGSPDPTPSPTPSVSPDPTPIPTDGIPGDADGDGGVDTLDALLTLRAAMGITEMTSLIANNCDVNSDGEVNVIDALLILRFTMGIIGGFI